MGAGPSLFSPKEGESTGIGFTLGREGNEGVPASVGWTPPPPVLPDLDIRTPQASLAAVRCFDGISDRDPAVGSSGGAGGVGRSLQRELLRQQPPMLSLTKEWERITRPEEEARPPSTVVKDVATVSSSPSKVEPSGAIVVASARLDPLTGQQVGSEWGRTTHRLTIGTIRDNAYERGYDYIYLREGPEDSSGAERGGSEEEQKIGWKEIDASAPCDLEIRARELEKLDHVDMYPRQVSPPPRWVVVDWEPEVAVPELKPRPEDLPPPEALPPPGMMEDEDTPPKRSSRFRTTSEVAGNVLGLFGSTRDSRTEAVSRHSSRRDSGGGAVSRHGSRRESMRDSRADSVDEGEEDEHERMGRPSHESRPSVQSRGSVLTQSGENPLQNVKEEKDEDQQDSQYESMPKVSREFQRSRSVKFPEEPAELTAEEKENQEPEVKGPNNGEQLEKEKEKEEDGPYQLAGTLSLYVVADGKEYEVRPPGSIRAWRKDFDREREKKLTAEKGGKFTPAMEKRPRFPRKNV